MEKAKYFDYLEVAREMKYPRGSLPIADRERRKVFQGLIHL